MVNSSSFILLSGLLFMITSPLVKLSSPPSMFSSVDLPLPEVPTIATNSPYFISKLILSSAFTRFSFYPYILTKFSAFNILMFFLL